MTFTGTSYDPETLALVARAFDAAWREAETGYPPRLYNQAFTRKLMALRIMEAADFGERDPKRLKLCALRTIERRDLRPREGTNESTPG